MKANVSRKLIFTSLLIAFFSFFSGLIVNLLTNNNEFKKLTDEYLGMTTLVIGVILSGTALLIFTYFQLQYAKQSEQISEKDNLAENAEGDVKKYYASLKERYRKRYESKLDGRFEITLEVSENWDGENTKNFKGEYEGKGQISEAFEYINSAFEKHGRLLIVGNPGVGKTVLLLKLALELLEKADIEKKEAFPVIFNLASWSAEYEKFDDWLISVLNSGEGLSKDFAGKLLQEERIIFLLDGLDELARSEEKETAAKERAKCLQSLNEYLDRGKKAVICCRVNEFELLQTLTGKDAPVSVKVKVNILTEAEVLNTLIKIEENETDKVAAANLLKILKKDENNIFLKVLSTPFYFTTALEVFDKQIFEEVDLPNEVKDLENYLKRKFIEKKLTKTRNPNEFGKEETKRWLIYLAEFINKKKLITFEFSYLQPSDLTGKQKFSLVGGLIGGLVCGVLCGLYIGFIAFLINGLFDGLFVGVLAGLIISLFMGLFVSLFIESKKIQTEDIISLKFSKLFKLKFWSDVINGFLDGLFYGLVGGTVVGATVGVIASIVVGLVYYSLSLGFGVGLVIGFFISVISGLLISVLFGVGISFEKVKIIRRFSRLENPYQRVKGGFLFNLYFSLVLSFLLTIISLLFLGFYSQTLKESFYGIEVLLVGFTLFIGFFLSLGLVNLLITPFFRHSILRFCLYLEDKMPLKYATFLDYAAEARILEKDGGHWRFRHQKLQDYFAELDEQSESPMGD